MSEVTNKIHCIPEINIVTFPTLNSIDVNAPVAWAIDQIRKTYLFEKSI